MKRPSFQFYHGDWRSNAKLRRIPHAQRCIWLEVMCLMADSDEFGVLRWPLNELSNAVPCRVADLRFLIDKEILKGASAGERCKPLIYIPKHARQVGEPVVLIPDQDGPIWYSSRMVRDAYIASIRGKGTRFGAAPDDSPTGRIGDGPSSSSSSSASQKPPSAAGAAPPGFEEAWQALPKRAGNNPRGRAERAYRARVAEGCTPEEMRDGAMRYAKFCNATGKVGSEYVMQGATFFGPERPFRQAWTAANGSGEWWSTPDKILAKARELGISTIGESSEALKAQIRERLA